MILNSPCNPTGAVYTHADWVALGEVLRRYPDAVILSAYILQAGAKSPAGRAALTDATAAQFVFPGAQKSQQASGATLNFVPANNLAQFMRGMQNMKTLAEGGTLPPPPARGGR